MPSPTFEDDYQGPEVAQEFNSKADLLVGKIYQLLDKKHWKFEAPEESWHPGACYDFDENRKEANLLKGTSRHPGRRIDAYIQIEPDEANGLEKTTWFSINSLFAFRSRLIELLHHDRLMGSLSAQDLNAIRSGLNIFRNDGADE